MKCIHCHGQLRRGSAPFSIDRRGYHISWDKILAWVCVQCGEAQFEAREVEIIQRALATIDQQTTDLSAEASSL